MWIVKEPTLSESAQSKVNFLFNNGKFYIMDNHLAAAWCWLQKIDVRKQYNLLHIDRHYDLLDFPETAKKQIVEKGVDLQRLSFEEYLNLRQILRNGDTAQMFRFDTYIMYLYLVYPNLFLEGYFATHDEGDYKVDSVITFRPDVLSLDGNVNHWITSHPKNKWIVNLDIDYFFKDLSSGKEYQFLSDQYILQVCDGISKSIDNIEVVTIALSPEFCNGWDNALRITDLISSHFSLGFKL